MSCGVREAAAPQCYLKESRDFAKLDEKFSFPFTSIRTFLLLLNFLKVDGGKLQGRAWQTNLSKKEKVVDNDDDMVVMKNHEQASSEDQNLGN